MMQRTQHPCRRARKQLETRRHLTEITGYFEKIEAAALHPNASAHCNARVACRAFDWSHVYYGRVTHLTFSQLRARYVIEGRPLEASVEAKLRADPRPGARAILEAIERRRRARRSEGQRLRMMLRFETELWTSGLAHVAGVDEAGMSPLAGPVAAAAVILAPGSRIAGVDDSKKLDARTREELAARIKQDCVAWSVAFAEVEEIDTLNIYWAGLLAMRRAVEGLSQEPQHLLVDARTIKDLQTPQQGIVKGDAKSLSIAAASILAKTARDALMLEFEERYPGYGFAKHKGYPVKQHTAALSELGACPVHRRSFAPVRQALGLPPLPPWPSPADRAQLSLELSGE